MGGGVRRSRKWGMEGGSGEECGESGLLSKSTLFVG